MVMQQDAPRTERDLLCLSMPSTWCPTRGGLDTHANCVKGEGVVYIHHVQGTDTYGYFFSLFNCLFTQSASIR